MGESAFKSHMKSERQKNNSGSRQLMTLASFGFVSCGNRDAAELGKGESSQSKQQPAMIIPPPPQDALMGIGLLT